MPRWLLTLLCLPAGACLSAPLYEATPRVDLIVAATTDVHGHLRGWDYYRNVPDSLTGLARAATVVDSLRRGAAVSPVLVDAGDILQGTPLTYVAARVDSSLAHPVILAMNAMQYDAGVVGNHEFNYGLATLDRAVRQADFPLLAANIYNADGRRRYRAWAFSTRGGIKIAIVGATTPGSMVWDRDNLSGRVTIRDIIPEVRTAVREARGAGAAVVVVVVHSGLNEPSSYDTVATTLGGVVPTALGTVVATTLGSENVAARLAHEVPGIDVLVYGHSHKEMADTVIGTTLLMQPRNWAASVGIAHLTLERHRGRWDVVAKRSRVLATAGHKENALVVAATAEGHRAAVRYANTAIGSTPVAWRADSARVADTPLIDFILEVERQASGAQLASTAAFSLNASLAAGPITVARLAALYPYENTLRAVRISGAQLREYLEQSARYFRQAPGGGVEVDPGIPGYNYDIVKGVDYTIDLGRTAGERITSLSFGGRPVTPADTFTIALNNYRQTGGGGFSMLRTAPVVYDQQREIRQLLIDEVKRKGTLRPGDYFHPSWRIVPSSAIARLLESP